MYTIGHSNHVIERFLQLLDRFGIDCICDVRSAPYSRHNPQFNRETLRASLKQHGLGYVDLGRELGARAADPACYVDDRVRFDLLAATPGFQGGLDRLIEGNARFTIAMMCAEKEPLNCHRTILIARHLVERGIPIEHILEDGTTEPHEATVERLIDLVGLEQSDLFLTRPQIAAEAYRLREEQVAYRRVPRDLP